MNFGIVLVIILIAVYSGGNFNTSVSAQGDKEGQAC